MKALKSILVTTVSLVVCGSVFAASAAPRYSVGGTQGYTVKSTVPAYSYSKYGGPSVLNPGASNNSVSTQNSTGTVSQSAAYAAGYTTGTPFGVMRTAMPTSAQFVKTSTATPVTPVTPAADLSIQGYKFVQWSSVKHEGFNGGTSTTGLLTKNSEMPVSGKAHYTGIVVGNMAGLPLNGTTSADADFAKKTIALSLNNLSLTRSNKSTMALGSYSGTAPIKGPLFNGSLANTTTKATAGSFGGEFRGAGAAEITGQAKISTAVGNGLVSFAAKK